MGREDERTNLSKYCRQFCALLNDFPQVTASTGVSRKKGVLSGSTFRSPVRDGPEAGR